MCFNCEYAKEMEVGYKIFYTCKLADKESEIVDTYFNDRESLIECPKDIYNKLKMKQERSNHEDISNT